MSVNDSKNRTGGKVGRKLLVKLIPGGLILTAVLVAAILFLPIFGKPLIQLTATEEQDASEIVLLETKDLFQLSSVEYVHKAVFPFDFIEPGLSYTAVFDKLETAAKKYADEDLSATQQLAKALRENMSSAEQLFLLTANLANQSGLHTSGLTEPTEHWATKKKFDFLVATIVVSAGFDLSGTPFAEHVETSGIAPSDAPQPKSESSLNVSDWISINDEVIESDGKKGKTLRIRLPPVRITKVEIEDPIRDQYPFPDIDLKPEGWRKIANFIHDRAIDEAISNGVLDAARQNAAEFFKSFFSQAGYDQVFVIFDDIEPLNSAEPQVSPDEGNQPTETAKP